MAASHVPYDSLSDAEVMLRAGTDDDAAYEYLVTKYHRPMIAFMYRMCRNQALAEELAQEVFLRVYRSRRAMRRKPSLRPGSIASPPTWR
jgi:RNA polymerase sigma-70 factor, ECF subfamily